MKKTIFLAGLLSIIGFNFGFSASTALQNLTITIPSISNITTSGNPSALSVNLNPDGTGSATDNTTTYTVTANTGAKGTFKITGAITSGGEMPDNTSLTASLASKAGSSAGVQTLTTKTMDLVTKLPTLLSDTGVITYGFNITNGWTVPAQTINRTVTLTLTSGS